MAKHAPIGTANEHESDEERGLFAIRVGLEAMSAGVPLVVENRGGWTEMIRHGRTGCLCNNEEEMVEQITRLAREPRHRQTMIEQARHVVETELANPEAWWQRWKNLLAELSS